MRPRSSPHHRLALAREDEVLNWNVKVTHPMPKRMNLANRTAVVTGAASGIGRAIALSLLRRGCHLALVDVNEGGLRETAEMVQAQAASDVRISRHRLDVADRDAVAA